MGACGSLRVARATDFMIKAATAVGAAVEHAVGDSGQMIAMPLEFSCGGCGGHSVPFASVCRSDQSSGTVAANATIR